MSNRALEIRTRMAELQKEFSTLNTELKDMQEIERRKLSHEKFKDYKYKVGCYGNLLYEEEFIQEVSDLDREEAVVGKSGFVYTNSETKDGYCALMLKDKAEYSRLKLLFTRLEAAQKINENNAEKQKYIRILLGEPDEA